MSNKPNLKPVVQRPTVSNNPPPSSYKLDTTKTMLNGLILTPNFLGKGYQQASSFEQWNQNPSSNELDFQPPVPPSTANLLSMAEEKVRAMSTSSNPNPNRPGGTSGGVKKKTNPKAHLPGTSAASPLMVTQLSRQQKHPNLNKPRESSKGKSLVLNDNHTTSSTDPLKWLRGEQAELKSRTRIQSRTARHSKSTPSPSNKIKEIFAPEEPDKLITIGGYIINIERGLPPQMSTSVRPMVTSNERGVEIEVRIKEVDPAKIVVEKRYNSILVIGVKESGLKTPRDGLPPSDTSLPFGFEDDVIEVVNIFAPRDISLTRVMVTPADSKGRLFIKAP